MAIGQREGQTAACKAVCRAHRDHATRCQRRNPCPASGLGFGAPAPSRRIPLQNWAAPRIPVLEKAVAFSKRMRRFKNRASRAARAAQERERSRLTRLESRGSWRWADHRPSSLPEVNLIVFAGVDHQGVGSAIRSSTAAADVRGLPLAGGSTPPVRILSLDPSSAWKHCASLNLGQIGQAGSRAADRESTKPRFSRRAFSRSDLPRPDRVTFRQRRASGSNSRALAELPGSSSRTHRTPHHQGYRPNRSHRVRWDFTYARRRHRARSAALGSCV